MRGRGLACQENFGQRNLDGDGFGGGDALPRLLEEALDDDA
jgi:hypothetical protein